MVTYVYERITARGRRSGTCDVCGKPAQRSRTFENTVNPFNRNADGTVRTRTEVRANVSRLAREWELGQVRHAGCEAGPS